MSRLRSALASLAAMVGISVGAAGGASGSLGDQVREARQAQQGQQNQDRESPKNRGAIGLSMETLMRRLYGGKGIRRVGLGKPGPSQAKVQRMARKARNQAKNRRAHRN